VVREAGDVSEVVGLHLSTQIDVDTQPSELAGQVVSDVTDRGPERRVRGDLHRPAELVGALEERHLMSAPGSHPGRLHARGTTADDVDLTRTPDSHAHRGRVAPARSPR
jgi:hypothetical protein